MSLRMWVSNIDTCQSGLPSPYFTFCSKLFECVSDCHLSGESSWEHIFLCPETPEMREGWIPCVPIRTWKINNNRVKFQLSGTAFSLKIRPGRKWGTVMYWNWKLLSAQENPPHSQIVLTLLGKEKWMYNQTKQKHLKQTNKPTVP